MSYTPETIVAIATPPGRGGIGIVRLSGSVATRIVSQLLRDSAGQELVPGRARFGYLLDPSASQSEPGDPLAATPGKVLDEVVTTFFSAGHSYTGDDVVEIAAHGSPVVLETIVRRAVELGARLAEPGEFTQRAFLSGRMDLTQAEAVHDLISASTLHQARLAATQLGGALSRAVQPLKRDLLQLIATLEAGIDFAEDDLEVMPESEIRDRLAALSHAVAPLERSYRYGAILREGRSLAIVGRPNAGKSSLFNALLARDRAIVTATPGTTRDALSEQTSIAGIPVQITDTAGLRDAADEIEALGIARSREVLADAALVLLVVDATAGTTLAAEEHLLGGTARPGTIVVWNKSDLLGGESPSAMPPALAPTREDGRALPQVRVSARTGSGLDRLREVIHAELVGETASLDSAFLTNERQHRAVAGATAALAAAQAALKQQVPHEMLLLDLYQALGSLDSLTGTTTPDDVLNLIFSTFCIGK